MVAISGSVIVGRDAAFYLNIAEQVVEHGPGVAQAQFDWPWFAILLAATNWLLGLPLEQAAYLWCALLMAGTCALMVAIIERRLAVSGYWACLVVLSVPAFNQFRYDIIREFGFWFFSILALGLALRWLERGDWRSAAWLQAAIIAAALFRLEAVFLLPVVSLCLLPKLNTREAWGRLLQINILPMVGILTVLIRAMSGGEAHAARIAYYASLLTPHSLLARFDAIAGAFTQAALQEYARGDAYVMVFFGLVALIVSKFLYLCGPFALPFLYPASWLAVGDYWRRLRPFAYAWLLYFCILLLFVVQLGFINSRYISFLNLLSVPLLTMMLVSFFRRFPRYSKIFVALALVIMMANVVSLGAKKTHYLEASAWLSHNTQPSDAIYYDDSRVAYYAGRGYPTTMPTREQLLAEEGKSAKRFRYFVISAKENDPLLERWLTSQGKRVLSKFANRKGETLLIVGD